MTDHSKISREFARQIAASLLAAADAESAQQILRDTVGCAEDVVNGDSAAEATFDFAEEGDGRIGPWIPSSGSRRSYHRREDLDPEGVWSRTEFIPAKSSKRRIVMLGESVARGFLYDPDFNCAAAFEHFLRANQLDEESEFVDLAQSGMSFEQLFDMTLSALALEPDALVVFAGNNWKAALGVPADEMAQLLEQGKSWTEAAECFDRTLRSATVKLASRLGEISSRHSIPVVFVIPEFNAMDWRSAPEWRQPLVQGACAVIWRRLRAAAAHATVARDYHWMKEVAESMIRLDAGSPAPYEMLALCHERAGDYAAAARFTDQAGDACVRLPFLTGARCFPIIRNTLRKALPDHGIGVVDLPDAFRQFLGGALPGRNLFLDFCHLNETGLWLAMASTLEVLLPLLGRPRIPASRLMAQRHKLSPKTRCQAHFKAALVNANRGQDYEIVRFHIDEAISAVPDASELATLFGDLLLRRAPYRMCASLQRLCAKQEEFPSISELIKATGAQEKQLNRVFLEALVDGISQTPADTDLQRTLVSEHAITRQPLNLLASTYSDTNVARTDHAWWTRHVRLQSREPESRFHLICDEPIAIQLDLVSRVPAPVIEGEQISVEVNGTVVKAFDPGTRWQRERVVVPAERLQRGWNSLVVYWPEPALTETKRTQYVTRHLGESAANPGRRTEVYPVYGELHAVTARAYPITTSVEDLSRETLPACDNSSAYTVTSSAF